MGVIETCNNKAHIYVNIEVSSYLRRLTMVFDFREKRGIDKQQKSCPHPRGPNAR